ncbi:hypothetical protein NDU88_005199 [Pleurodeles waltl]|uniref:Uncharacterized protein n=1 Tax=Pleurodeles waltl TaxID=8319 RepID=A0AAV7M8L6_PLEWA|nr:hypothetical protein NDU88_005199 [Pleurodeles waltl]
MGRHKRMDPSQGNTMEQYTNPVPLPQRPAQADGSRDGVRVPVTSDELSHMELLAAIQGSRVALEGKIETVAVEVNLLQADLLKVSDKVKVAEGSIVELQTEVGTLRKQMVQATSTVGRLKARSDSQLSNAHLSGFTIDEAPDLITISDLVDEKFVENQEIPVNDNHDVDKVSRMGFTTNLHKTSSLKPSSKFNPMLPSGNRIDTFH